MKNKLTDIVVQANERRRAKGQAISPQLEEALREAKQADAAAEALSELMAEFKKEGKRLPMSVAREMLKGDW